MWLSNLRFQILQRTSAELEALRLLNGPPAASRHQSVLAEPPSSLPYLQQ